MINEYPSCDDFQSELAYGDAAPRIALGRSIAVLRYHVIGYMTLYDRDDGSPNTYVDN